MMTRRFVFPVLLAAVLSAMAGCGQDPGPAATGADSPAIDVAAPRTGLAALEGEWQLVGGSTADGPVDVLDHYPVTLTVTDGEATGKAACNLYGGPFHAVGDGISFPSPEWTEMGCEQPVMDLEMTYLAALSAVGRARHDGDALVLTGTDVELRFEPVPELADTPLVGTDWVLDTVVTGGTGSSASESASSTRGDPAVTLSFAGDGTLTGSTGCRWFTGTWREEAGRVEVADLELAELEPEEPLCDHDATRRQDDRVWSILDGGVEVEIDGDRLRLSGADGGLVYRTEH
ncbi:Heat shock protein HslJ [Actinoalloteichus cyanogriseus DSM 43889]|uniref:Heat shock protein HslJ n=2 Tax=Actinoalloteichus cyanogriseus TaxID=2893586 RepID=A0ABT1JFV9_ACTCY|nr:Heat shock protein HslJ [Actinoalloteichus caeruleus DSM 43889]